LWLSLSKSVLQCTLELYCGRLLEFYAPLVFSWFISSLPKIWERVGSICYYFPREWGILFPVSLNIEIRSFIWEECFGGAPNLPNRLASALYLSSIMFPSSTCSFMWSQNFYIFLFYQPCYVKNRKFWKGLQSIQEWWWPFSLSIFKI